jgi:hypothetical protein
MDAPELAEWEALYTLIEPMPENRADLRMGITVANGLAPHIRRGAAMPQPADFIPRFGEDTKKPKQTIEQQKAIWQQAVRAMNPRKKQ